MSSTSVELNPSSSSLSNDVPSDDFVHVSPSSSLDQSSKLSIKGHVNPEEDDPNRPESNIEDDIVEKVIALGKENERLKETLKHNNLVLQQYIKDFTDMKEAHRANNENIKKENQKAKEVVKKLRDDNRTLKGELKKVQSQNIQEISKGKLEDLERDNAFMKQQISSLQEHIKAIDSDLKDCEISENIADNWQQLLGSLASYNYKSGISQRNEDPLCTELNGERASGYPNKTADQITQDVATEILKVDFEKVKVEKQHLEEKLSETKEELKKLKEISGRMTEEKEEFRNMFDEQCMVNLKKDKDCKEIADTSQTLQLENQKLKEELATINEELAKKSEENKDLMSKVKNTEMELKLKNQEDDDDDDIHNICNEKFAAMQYQYFQLQKEMNNMEKRENSLCAKEKALEKEKENMIQQGREQTRQHYSAELDNHSKMFIEKTEQLHSELQQAREREESLQEQLALVQSEYSEKEESFQLQVCQLIKENDSMRVKIEKLTELNSRRDILYEERMKDLEKNKKAEIQEKTGIIDMLHKQHGVAKEEIKKRHDEYALTRIELERVTSQYEQLMKEYDELLNSFNGTLEENRMRNSSSSAEIESYKGKMDDLASHYAAAHEACLKKEAVIKDLQERLRTAEMQSNEELPVVKQQMEVYFNDFKAEREARERQHADLLNLQEQNQRLVEANRGLQRELDNLQNNHQMAEMQRRHLSHTGSVNYNPEAFRQGFQTRRGGDPVQRLEDFEWPRDQQRPESRPPPQDQEHELEEPFNCPGCGLEFWSFDAGEQHVRQCQAAMQRNRQPINNNQCPICGNEYPDQDTLEIHVQDCLRDNI